MGPSGAQADAGDAGRAEGRATDVRARGAAHAARPDRYQPEEHHPCPTLPTTAAPTPGAPATAAEGGALTTTRRRSPSATATFPRSLPRTPSTRWTACPRVTAGPPGISPLR